MLKIKKEMFDFGLFKYISVIKLNLLSFIKFNFLILSNNNKYCKISIYYIIKKLINLKIPAIV